jgi:hypothetical protein
MQFTWDPEYRVKISDWAHAATGYFHEPRK